MIVLRLYDNVHLLSVDTIVMIPTKPPVFFPLAFSHFVLWPNETRLKRRYVPFTTNVLLGTQGGLLVVEPTSQPGTQYPTWRSSHDPTRKGMAAYA